MVANSRWATSDVLTALKLNASVNKWGADADKGSPALVGDAYLATDTLKLYISTNGTTWNYYVYVNLGAKDVINGIAGIGANKELWGGLFNHFNLLKIGSNNLFTRTKNGTAAETYDPANGTVGLSLPANADWIILLETARIAPSLLPRIMVIRINEITLNGANAFVSIGFHVNDSRVTTSQITITTSNGGANWNFRTDVTGTSTLTAIAAPAVGDIFVIYLTSNRAILWKNGAELAVHTTNITGLGVGRGVCLGSQAGEGAGSSLTLGSL